MTDKEDQPLGTWLRDYGQEVAARRNERSRVVALESEIASLKGMVEALERRIITLEGRQPVYVPVPPLRTWVPPHPTISPLTINRPVQPTVTPPLFTIEPHEDHQVVS